MIDLYQIHSDFPGLPGAERVRHLFRDRVARLEKAFADDIGDPRFIPNIQLHEFETLLFVKPAAFECFYSGYGEQIAKLEEIANACQSPEEIDDGPQTAPSKRIISEFRDYESAKPVAGPQIAAQIGLDSMRQKCPHFDAWLTRLESLGQVET